MTLLTLKELTADIIGERAKVAGEPHWLVERRREAWAHFAQAGPPEWRRTDLSGIDPTALAPSSDTLVTIELDASLERLGVVAKPLRAALTSHEALIQRYLDTAVAPLEHKFSALRAALWQDGAFIFVPKDVAAEMPIRVRYHLPPIGHTTLPRTLVIAEAHSSLTLIEEFSSPDQSVPSLAAPISEIFAGPGSSVRFISAQRWGNGVYHIAGQKAVLEQDANLEWTSIGLGAKVQHIEAETTLKGNGSQVNWYGATFAGSDQLLLTGPWLRHVGHRAESFMQFKTVVNGNGYSVFDGMIKIEHESAATSTRLEEHALHLSPQARNDSIPGLKIDTNSVLKGGHASTSGDVDEEQLFYMQARGISKTEAKRMIVMGFFSPALDSIPVESLREELEATIESKI
ncbi:SufB/SufD family protein [Candidatus Viridilinea mediisalina]|uniref:Fe-S cluster assembly protein SufD n=1 Tax=Candidatus Viridilinea mediisalina TaxID=2024553 RepID=A0A2A6RIN3_9CHLR|nr:SufD family Fe-S cluster assembly protein [Candidatus Viridilinea mediisalina]PDW02803.1 Fe-S cluster assembly protein SufD [Candidatus Viridilinea mediisalina]